MTVLNTDYYRGTDRYSDGDIEDTILNIVRSHKTLAGAGDVSFPVLYHLSEVRENILSWYPFRQGASVLEIGAGPGAVTGLLCRKCARVTVAELSLRRSQINYERHRDCGNLEIMVGNLNDMQFAEKFDYVVLNGVFEYAGSFTEGPDPYGTFLKHCRSFLREDGILLTAIENRLGLKYFAGAPEDHTDNYMEGLKDYPDNTAVHTFSKGEWEELCARCGLPSVRFYYPYPDYKFPGEIFTGASLSADSFSRNAWNFSPKRLSLFPEHQMAAALCREGVMDRFMNSFLIEAGGSASEHARGEEEVLYAKISADRGRSFRIQTLICSRDGKKTVVKEPLTPEAEEHLRRMHLRETSQETAACLTWKDETWPVRLLEGREREEGGLEYPFLDGVNLGRETAGAAMAGDAGAVTEAVRALYDLILCGRTRRDADDASFSGVFGPARDGKAREMVCPANIDLIFDNIFLTKDHTAAVIDAEWVFDFPVPAAFILWRAVNELYCVHPELEKTLPQAQLLAGYGIGAEDRQLFWKWADHFEREYVQANALAAYARPVMDADLKDLRPSGGQVRMTATLYLDTGAGFREEESLHAELTVEKGQYDVTFEVPHPAQVKAMRFDPLEGSACICSLSSEDASLRPVNASAHRKGAWEFLTMDPAYRVRWQRDAGASDEMRTLRITGHIETKDVHWALAKSQELLGRYRRGPIGAAVQRIRKR